MTQTHDSKKTADLFASRENIFYFIAHALFEEALIGIRIWNRKMRANMRRFMRVHDAGMPGGLIFHFLSRISRNFTYQNVFIKITFTIQRIHRKIFDVCLPCFRSKPASEHRWMLLYLIWRMENEAGLAWEKREKQNVNVSHFNNDWHK